MKTLSMIRVGVLLTLLMARSLLFGQTLTVSVPTVSANVGSAVYIPVKLTGASSTGVPISGANIQIAFDTAVLKYDTLTNFYSAMPQSQWFFAGNNGVVSANWLEPSLLTLAIPNNTTLYEIKFTKKTAGTSPLTFTVNEFTDGAYNVIPTTPVNGAVTDPAVFRQVTFRVDMTRETISPDGVHLAGSFNNWNYSQTAMTFTPGTSIYNVTLSLQEGSTYQYRFVNGSSASGLETVPASCGVSNGSGQYNRQVTIPAHDTIYPVVCFSMCGPCPVNVSVTFRADMQHQTVSPDGVHVAGNFNNWNYLQNALAGSGGTIYETTVIMEQGINVEFKFANGNSSTVAESVPAACALNGNRYFTVPGQDTVLTAFCYDSCLACGTTAKYSMVTFLVDLRTQMMISPDGVHIAGTFQGWDPGATPMINTVDSIFTHTESLLAGTSIQYKFINGNTSAGYEIVPFTCSTNGNRLLLVPGNDTTLHLVCFSECDTCLTTGTRELEKDHPALFQNYPNPCRGLTHIGYTIPSAGEVELSIINSTGREVSQFRERLATPGIHYVTLSCQDFPSGVYLYQLKYNVSGQTVLINKKMIIQ